MSSETSDLDPEAPGYRVWCEDCDMEKEFHESEPQTVRSVTGIHGSEP